MKVMSTVLVALVLAALGASWAQGTQEWSFEAFQPVWTDNDISLSRVTVLTFSSGEVGVYAVLATCDSNRVMTDSGPQQRNAAFEVGLRTEVTFDSNGQSPLRGDTLRVEGNAVYRNYGGNFATAPFRNGPKTREFEER